MGLPATKDWYVKLSGKYNQTLLLRASLGPEKVSVLQGVLIKRAKFKENVWSGTKKTAHNNECPY